MANKERILITGVTGQVGSYLADIGLEHENEVYGLVRRASTQNTERIQQHLDNKYFHLVEGDLTDGAGLERIIKTIRPHVIFNCAAQSHVQTSFEQPLTTADITGLGVTRLLEAIRGCEFRPKFIQCSTSEMFGKVQETPQTETTPFYPRSPYGAAKLYAHWMTINYRESYNLFACCAIMFNTESPRRGENFVTKKITKAIARISLGLQDYISLGNLDAKRDWSYAKDSAMGIYLMSQYHTPEEFVFASGETHAVQEFADKAFGYIDKKASDYIRTDTRFTRPAEVDLLLGDSTKARRLLSWQPTKTFDELIECMVKYDLEKEASNGLRNQET